LRESECVKYISYFKQHKCGSLVHAHSQIISTPVVPSFVDNLAMRAHNFHDYYNACAVCRTMIINPTGRGRNFIAQERLVFESEHFVVSVPFAARSRHRLLIAPRRHDKDFLSLSEAEAQDFARVLQKCCKLYYCNLDDVAWNLAIYTCPVRMDPGHEANMYEHAFHWHAALYPRRTEGAPGFKLATDIAENSQLPEDDAAEMRKCIAESPLRYSPNP